jgi:uncharacterized membrane protein HdeD (DUF308 family)
VSGATERSVDWSVHYNQDENDRSLSRTTRLKEKFAMSSPDATSASHQVPPLRRLYFVRAGFAFVWAGLFAATSSPLGNAALALAVLYPLFDLGAAVVDARSASAAGRPTKPLYVNMLVSLAAAVGIVVAGKDVQAILVVWGAWAVTAGAVQLIVAILRKQQLGGQWAMILSGGISVFAGAGFAAMAADATEVTSIAGYATLGGLFFLVSALRLSRTAGPVPAAVS